MGGSEYSPCGTPRERLKSSGGVQAEASYSPEDVLSQEGSLPYAYVDSVGLDPAESEAVSGGSIARQHSRIFVNTSSKMMNEIQ